MVSVNILIQKSFILPNPQCPLASSSRRQDVSINRRGFVVPAVLLRVRQTIHGNSPDVLRFTSDGEED